MRSALELDRIAEALGVDKAYCFQPRDGLTHCNDYVCCFVAALGAPFAPAGTLANAQHTWLTDTSHHWRQVDAVDAAKRADLGFPVVASWFNQTGGHGHIAVVMPASAPGHLFVSAAGAKNFVCAPIENSFGLQIHPDFFTTDA